MIFNIFSFIAADNDFQCPLLGGEWKTFKSTSKCYAARSLAANERTFSQAKSICSTQLPNGNLVDLEYEDIMEIGRSLENLVDDNPSIESAINIDGKDYVGFFINHIIEQKNGNNEYQWISGREISTNYLKGDNSQKLVAVTSGAE